MASYYAGRSLMTLRFNSTRTVMIAPELFDYVVVHELAHLKVPDHPARFWGVATTATSDVDGQRMPTVDSTLTLWPPSACLIDRHSDDLPHRQALRSPA